MPTTKPTNVTLTASELGAVRNLKFAGYSDTRARAAVIALRKPKPAPTPRGFAAGELSASELGAVKHLQRSGYTAGRATLRVLEQRAGKGK
jgi:hypothetical protein